MILLYLQTLIRVIKMSIILLVLFGFHTPLYAYKCWARDDPGIAKSPTLTITDVSGVIKEQDIDSCEITLGQNDIATISFVTTADTTVRVCSHGGGVFEEETVATGERLHIFTFKAKESFIGTSGLIFCVESVNPGHSGPSYGIEITVVSDSPSITSSPVTEAQENVPYEYDVDATDRNIGDVLTYSLDDFPTGMAIDPSTGLISWTPGSTQIGDNSVTTRVTDTTGLSDTQGFFVSVIEKEPPPTAANKDFSGTSEDPINTYTGELFNQYSPEINLGGPLPLYFARYYASGLLSNDISSTVGDNWRHNFEWTLETDDEDVYIVNHKGRLIQFRDGDLYDPDGNVDIAYQLNENGGVFTLLDPRSRLMYKFSDSGGLTSIEDGKGNIHTLSYSGSDDEGSDDYDSNGGQLEQVTDSLGRTLSFSYDDDEFLVTVGDGTRTVTFAHTGNDLTQVTDALGNITTYAYDSGGLMTSWTLPEGNIPYTQTYKTYNAFAAVESQTDSDGNTTTLEYTEEDEEYITTITDALGNTRVHTHTANGEFSNRQDQVGKSFSMGSDSTGRRDSITDRMGDTTSLTYHAPSGQISSVTNADGTTKSYTYTARDSGNVTVYDLTGITHEDGTTETFVYDASGNLTSFVDQLGNTTSGVYNDNGQPLTATNVAGGVTSHIYKADGTQLSTTNPQGNTTTFGYDTLKRPTLITNADGTTQGLLYDDDDNLLSSTDENGNAVTMAYDANSNLAGITDSLLNTTNFTYDGNDRLISTTDPLGGVASLTYDPYDRIKTLTDQNGGVIALGYNNLGRLTSITDPMGNITTSTYDAEAIITSRTDPFGNTTTFSSDSMGRITQTTSPLGSTLGVGYDPMGRISSAIDPLGNTTALSRDTRGLLSGITLPGGISASYTRDAFGDITALTDPNGNIWNRAYDNMGRLTSSTDPLVNSQSIVYDNRHRVSTITYPATLGTLTYGYDLAGNLTSSTYSDGTVFNFTYDANDRLTLANGITRSYDANDRISNSNGIAITRDTGGRITQMTLATGKIVSYTFDANDRVTQIADWAGGITTFTYDAAGRLTGIARPNGVNTTRTYDNDSRLTGLAEGAISTITLTRDAKGQITSATRNLPLSPVLTNSTTTITYDAASQVSSYTYDAMGRLTNRGADTFVWDPASRLTSYTVGGNTVTATYDAGGRRLSRTANGTTRNYVWNDALGLPSISIERQGSTGLKYYVHTPGGALLYSMDATSDARNFYHFDEMGNNLFVTNDAGTVIGSYAYTPYGKLTASTGALDNPFTWQGEYGIMDEGNGVYYVRARYYDADNGRFVSRDPIKSTTPKGVNPYQYALANPLRIVDVTGREGLFIERVREYADKVKVRLLLNRGKYDSGYNTAIDSLVEDDRKVVERVHALLFTLGPGYMGRSFSEELKAAEGNLSSSIELQEINRKALILHMKDRLDKARENADKALDALKTGGSRTKATQDALRKKRDAAEAYVKLAEQAFKDAGGVEPVESVVPELAPIGVSPW